MNLFFHIASNNNYSNTKTRSLPNQDLLVVDLNSFVNKGKVEIKLTYGDEETAICFSIDNASNLMNSNLSNAMLDFLNCAAYQKLLISQSLNSTDFNALFFDFIDKFDKKFDNKHEDKNLTQEELDEQVKINAFIKESLEAEKENNKIYFDEDNGFKDIMISITFITNGKSEVKKFKLVEVKTFYDFLLDTSLFLDENRALINQKNKRLFPKISLENLKKLADFGADVRKILLEQQEKKETKTLLYFSDKKNTDSTKSLIEEMYTMSDEILNKKKINLVLNSSDQQASTPGQINKKLITSGKTNNVLWFLFLLSSPASAWLVTEYQQSYKGGVNFTKVHDDPNALQTLFEERDKQKQSAVLAGTAASAVSEGAGKNQNNDQDQKQNDNVPEFANLVM